MEWPKGVPILGRTQRVAAASEVGQQAVEVGATGYIDKSSDRSTFRENIEAALAKAKLTGFSLALANNGKSKTALLVFEKTTGLKYPKNDQRSRLSPWLLRLSELPRFGQPLLFFWQYL